MKAGVEKGEGRRTGNELAEPSTPSPRSSSGPRSPAAPSLKRAVEAMRLEEEHVSLAGRARFVNKHWGASAAHAADGSSAAVWGPSLSTETQSQSRGAGGIAQCLRPKEHSPTPFYSLEAGERKRESGCLWSGTF